MKQLIKVLVKYKNFIPIIVLGLIPIIWFLGRGDVLINGVDTNFPLNPLIWFARRFYVWNNITNAGADFSSSTAGLFFHLIQVVPYLIGLKLQFVEIISLVFWFLLIVFSSFFFARAILPKKLLPQLLFTVFYSFNIYLFNSWENVKVANLSLVAGIPIILGALVLLDKKEISKSLAILISAIGGIVLSGTGINPSYFVSFFLTIFLYFIGVFIVSPEKRFEKTKNFLIVSAVVILVNAFWIFPALNFIIKGIPAGGSIDRIGFTNWINSLSENTSLFNILRLQGAWDWYALDQATGFPLYIPYALNYFYRLPFIVFSLIPPFLAILSLIFRKKENNNLYLSFSLMLLVGVFLGAGTHLPTGVFFRFLIDRFPFFSLFRSPWYIFTPLVFLSYAGLIALLFNRVSNILFSLICVTLIAGNFLYSYPLITGKIFRPQRSDGFYINFPNYVFDAGKWLVKEGSDGRIVSYPDDEIENFKWGYRGIESVLQLVANREVLFSSLNAPDSPVSRLIKEFYLRLKKQELDSAMKIAGKLNASLIFEKNDQGSLSPAIPKEIRTNFESQKFGEWAFYKLPGEKAGLKIFSPAGLVYSYPYSQGQIAISTLAGDSQIINMDDDEIKKIPNISELAGTAIIADNLQAKSFKEFIDSSSKLENRLTFRDFSKARFGLEVFEDGDYQPILERYHLEDFGINSDQSLKIMLDGREAVLEIDSLTDSHVFYKPIFLNKGRHNLDFPLNGKNLILGGDFEKGELFKRGGYGEGEAIYEIKEGEFGKYLSIANYGKAEASADFKVIDFDPFVPYYVEVGYRQIYGNNGLVVPAQNTPTTLVKAQNERLPNYPEWGKFSFYYDPVKTESEMKVFLVSPFTSDPLGTKIFYDDLVVRKVFVNNLAFVKNGKNFLSTPAVNYKKISPALYQGSVDKAAGPHVLVFAENYSPEWEIRVFNEEGLPIKAEPRHFSINLYANGWYFEGMPEKYQFKIYYRPQNLYISGLVVSGLVLIISIMLILFSRLRHDK